MNKKMKDIKGMSDTERQNKIKELKLELVKAGIRGQKTNAKTKDIKRVLARIFTFNRAEKAKRLSKN